MNEEYHINKAILDYYQSLKNGFQNLTDQDQTAIENNQVPDQLSEQESNQAKAPNNDESDQTLDNESDQTSDNESDQTLDNESDQTSDNESADQPKKTRKKIKWRIIKPSERLLNRSLPILNDFQKEIYQECLTKNGGGLSLPLGSGKTLISLILSLYYTNEDNGVALVVASKSLISSWAFEIKKFFGDKLSFEIVHSSKINIKKWKLNPKTQLVLTTPEVLSKSYKENHIDKQFVKSTFVNNGYGHLGNYINFYNQPDQPYLKHILGNGIFYSRKWSCLIIDEAQIYTNIETTRCQSIGSICSDHRWLLSGTLFSEPKVERILGYHILLNAKNMPRNLPDTKNFVDGHPVNGHTFNGLQEHLVLREKNEAFTPPKINHQIIEHNLSLEERKIYTTFREILLKIQRQAQAAQFNKDTELLKTLTAYKMVMVLYLRQILICPLIPIASIALASSDFKKRSELSTIIMQELGQMGINPWLDDVNSIYSSRIKSVMGCIDQHRGEKVIVFSCFRSFLDILEHYLSEDRTYFRMTSEMSLEKRGQLIEDFKNSDCGILMMTYELGATGLNLQFATTVLLVDQWWNGAKTSQAIGRIFRLGQKAEEINIYFFTSNTGIEKIIFEKQNAKKQILEELMTGAQETKVPRIKMDDVIKLIEMEDNRNLLQNIKYY